MTSINTIFCLLITVVFSSMSLSLENKNSNEIWKEKIEKLQKYIAENNIKEPNSGSRESNDSVGTDYFNLTISCPKPTSVHRLRPNNIDVVAAMGDSITAANGAGASTVAGIAREYRGISWSMGGEGEISNALTLPNILRLFNPDLKGYSVGTRFEEARDWWFNVAVPGAKANDLTGQARRLINAMKNDERIRFEDDWKLLTIFIGGNDLCDLDSSAGSQPENFVQSLKEALDMLHDQLPRTMINLVDILEMYLLPEIGYGYGSTRACRLMQRLFCKYIVNANKTEKENIKEKNKMYQDLTWDLISSGRYDTRDDFTIVIQPFLKDTVLPYTENGEVDSTYFAPDCFHFGTKGHAMGALNLWNNMMEPVGRKTTEWGLKNLKCPSEESPYIFTNLNSNYEGSGGETTTAEIVTDADGGSTTTTTTSTSSTTTQFFTSTSKQAISKTEPWIIAVICILAAAVLVQTIVLVTLLRNKSKRKDAEYLTKKCSI